MTENVSIFLGKNNDSILRRDILFWYIKNFKQGNRIKGFKFTELANWLLDHHDPFVQKYYKSHTRKSYQLIQNRSYMKGRVTELIELGFIDNKGKVKAQKNDEDTKLYSFTKQGSIFAWLVEAKFSTGDIRTIALEMFFTELSDYTATVSDSTFAGCLIEYFNQCIQRGLCARLDDYYLEPFFRLFPITKDYFRIFRLFFMFGFYTHEESARILLEIIGHLDDEKRELILLQLKLDIESNYYNEMDASLDWELKRYDNINNERIVTIQGYCLECRSKFPIEMDIMEFLQLGSHPKCYAPDGALYRTGTLICLKCRRIAARLIIPIWYVPTPYLNKEFFTFEHFNNVYPLIQTEGHASLSSGGPTTRCLPSLYILCFLIYYGYLSLPIV